MRFTMAIPPHLLEKLSPLCDIDFALAQITDEKYINFYREQREKHGRFVIMDNGMHETGRPLSIPELVTSAKAFRPSIVIAPDFLGDGKKTYEQLIAYLRVRPDQTGVACVIQGKDRAERIQLWENVRAKIDMVCFPFREQRLLWFQELVQATPRHVKWPAYIHLLGVSSLSELRQWKLLRAQFGLGERLSVDTTKPIKYGLANKRFGTEHPDASLRGLGGWPQDTKLMPALDGHLTDIYYNIAYMRRYA